MTLTATILASLVLRSRLSPHPPQPMRRDHARKDRAHAERKQRPRDKERSARPRNLTGNHATQVRNGNERGKERPAQDQDVP